VAVIIGLFSVSVILFIYRGYEAALYFSIIGIPIIFIIFASQYIKKLKTSRPDPGLTLKTQETEKLAYDLKALQSSAQNLRNTYGLQTDNTETALRTLTTKNFPLIGINVTETEGKYVTVLNELVIQKTDLDSIDNVSKELNDLESQLNDELKGFTNIVSQTYLSYLNTLKNSGYNIEPLASNLQSTIKNKKETSDITENIRYIDSITSIFRETLQSCITQADKLKQKVNELGKDISIIESDLKTAGEVVQSRNYRDFEISTTSLARIMHSLESSAGGDFSSIRSNLLNAIERILASVENKIENEATQNLLALKSQVMKLDSASKIGELQLIEPRIIPTASEIAKEVFENINKNEAMIKQADFPQLFYPARMPFEKEYADLMSELNVDSYSRKFSGLLQIIIPVMEKSHLKAKVIAIYKKIEGKIQSDIQHKGKITATDLKVKNPEEFMELYSYFHKDVLYDSFKKILSSQVSMTLYKISVRVLNEEHQPLNGAEVTLKIDDRVVKKDKTDKEGRLILGELMKSKYKISAKYEGYKTKIKNIELNEDQAFDIELNVVPLGDQLCKDKEESLQKILPKLNDIIQKEIASKKYILSTFDLKIKPEFTPCLLYLWSKNNGNTGFTRSGNDYMVYDVNVIRKEIEDFIDDIEIGKKAKISDMVDFLSAPLPTKDILVIIGELKKGSDDHKNIEYDASQIWKT
jgi:hypothetical protein